MKNKWGLMSELGELWDKVNFTLSFGDHNILYISGDS